MSVIKPRYVELTEMLLNDISSGAYPVGSCLPGELELAEKYGVGRGTVRAALDQIQALGLISRRKRAGTRVEASAPPATGYAPTISTVEELMQYSANTQRVIHSIKNIVVDVEMAARLGCAPGTHWMEVQAARADPLTHAYPVAWFHVYVRAADGNKIRRQLRHTQELICDLINDVTGSVVMEIRQTARAVGVPEALAAKLGVEPGAHALEFVRQYYDQSNTLMEVSISIQPADRFSYTTVLQRRMQPAGTAPA
ncbi:GntR family transcriptional regulator [Cupriavidus sp. 30B13]|uniref:GntR family transcriptional regulator n=1 Tax=Cupriavidus sp. 30B13 TaxID=3384241 RepID=UPI003B8EE71E